MSTCTQNIADNLKRKLPNGQLSFSQTGEDLIMSFICTSLGITQPSYLDIGAYHPIKFNNTYYFYQRGSVGINVEPNPNAIEAFLKERERDKNFNIGVASNPGTMTYFEFDAATLNTFSELEAKMYQQKGHKLVGTRESVVDTVENILTQSRFANFPHILNLDVEGFELSILQSIDFTTHRPLIICLETLTYDPIIGKGRKKQELIDLLTNMNYMIFADTHINTIMLCRDNL